MSQTKIIIDPRSSYSYGSFYIYGLTQLFGKHAIHYSLRPFLNMPNPGWNLRFVRVENGVATRYFIHTNDTWQISDTDYQWCDVYGSVNANFKNTPKSDYPKLVSLVPSFGINALSAADTTLLALGNFLKAWKSISSQQAWNKYKNRFEADAYKNIKHYFGKIYKTYKNRPAYSEYNNTLPSKNDYIFFCSTLWYDHPDNQNDAGVNLRRANFMRACKAIDGLKFEGGFVADSTSSKEKFADLLTIGVSMADWIEKTKQSALVFNTPAFWDCHGWKLGEYMALGKCILSTPLSKDLPAPLVHGKHIHIVEPNIEAIQEAIEYILSHPDYRHYLEQNAKAYWDQYGTPKKSLEILFSHNK